MCTRWYAVNKTEKNDKAYNMWILNMENGALRDILKLCILQGKIEIHGMTGFHILFFLWWIT